MNRKYVVVLTTLMAAAEGLSTPLFRSESTACAVAQGVSQVVTSDTFAQSQASNLSPSCHGGSSASGFAGPGGIGGRAYGKSNISIITGVSATHLGRVMFTTTFRNQSGTPGTADVALNLWLSSQYSDPIPGGGAVFLAVGTAVNGVIGGSSVTSVNPPQGFGLTHVQLGVTNQQLTTSVHTVPLNTPIGIMYDLTTTAGVSGGTLESEVVFIDAMNTLSFPKSGPVFNLAPGITVDDIPALYLFNNQFVQPSAAVPEQAYSMSLLGIAMAVFVGPRWRRVRRGGDGGMVR